MHQKPCVIYSSHKSFYPGGKDQTSTLALWDIVKKGQIDYSHRKHRECFPSRFDFSETHTTK